MGLGVERMKGPTQRTLAELKKRGCVYQVTEHWNPFARRRVDLFGVIDVLAIDGGRIIGIQTTSGDNHSKRIDKAREEPRLIAWLLAGGRFEVWSWAKRGARGKRKLWTLRRTEALLIEGIFGTIEKSEHLQPAEPA